VLAAGALAIRLRRRGPSPALWAVIAVLLAFWVTLAVGFNVSVGRTPTTVRYVYAGAFMALLVGVEAARGTRLAPNALVVLYGITVLALGANLARLREAGHFYRNFATALRAELTAIDLTRDRVNPYFVPKPLAYLSPVPAGPYLAAVDRIGSPAYSPAELANQSEETRQTADTVLIGALGIAVAPASPGEPVRNCRRLGPPQGSSLIMPVGPPGVRLSASSGGQIALRRFAAASTSPVGTVSPGRTVTLRIPADRSTRVWQAVITPAPASLSVCDLAGR
jgi:hypothetical protein